MQQVLKGQVSVAHVKTWLAQPSSLPPAPSVEGLDSPASPSKLCFFNSITPAHFRVQLLNHVKMEAEAVFAAAEQQAAAQQQASVSAQHATTAHAGQSRPLNPGAISDMAFPSLSVQSDMVGMLLTVVYWNIRHVTG